MAPQTTKFRTLALAAAVGNLERVAAAPAAQESRQKAPAPTCRLAGARLHIRVGFDHRQMPQIARPIKVPRMMVRNHDRPLIDREGVTGGPADSTVDNCRATRATAVDVRLREERIRDDGVHARVPR